MEGKKTLVPNPRSLSFPLQRDRGSNVNLAELFFFCKKTKNTPSISRSVSLPHEIRSDRKNPLPLVLSLSRSGETLAAPKFLCFRLAFPSPPSPATPPTLPPSPPSPPPLIYLVAEDMVLKVTPSNISTSESKVDILWSAGPNPFMAPDPFAVSNQVAAPPGVQMAAMAQQQAAMMMPPNPFAQPTPPLPQQNMFNAGTAVQQHMFNGGAAGPQHMFNGTAAPNPFGDTTGFGAFPVNNQPHHSNPFGSPLL